MNKYAFVEDADLINKHLKSALDGAFINLFTYGMTYWDIDFVSKDLISNKVVTSEIHIKNTDVWWDTLSKGPISLVSKEHDAMDTLVAMVLTHSTNSFVSSWHLHLDNTLEIEFENKGVIILPSVTDLNLGYSWRVPTNENKETTICNNAELFYRYEL